MAVRSLQKAMTHTKKTRNDRIPVIVKRAQNAQERSYDREDILIEGEIIHY